MCVGGAGACVCKVYSIRVETEALLTQTEMIKEKKLFQNTQLASLIPLSILLVEASLKLPF